MKLETDETWRDLWMDLWQLWFATEVWTRDCGIGGSLRPECQTCLVPSHVRQVFGLYLQIDRQKRWMKLMALWLSIDCLLS